MDVAYYTIVNRFTKIETEKWMIPHLKWDLDFLFDCVKSILIHPIDIRHERIRYNRTQNGLFHALNTTVEKMLSYEALQPYLKKHILPLGTIPHERAILSCDHHALLFTALIRNQQIPIRARTGYAKYIVKHALIPHWITEIYDKNRKAWYCVDPERRIEHVERDDFLFAHQAWKLKQETPTHIFPSYSNSKDRQGIKYALISDINCIFKNELLGYEWRHKSYQKKKPKIVHSSYERQDPEMQNALDRAAEYMEDPDTYFEQLQAFYSQYINEPETDLVP